MEIKVRPIAVVKNSRTTPEDDYWGEIISEIELCEDIPTKAFDSISDFSHLEIIYFFDKLDTKEILFSGQPRGNPQYPSVGIFAQRKKDRPNLLGLCTAELLEHNGRKIIVKYLDAINGTPVMDIKPVFREFQPKNEIRQPKWASDLMKDYWRNESSNNITTLFQSKEQILSLINRADDNHETKRLISKFSELKNSRNPFYLNISEFDEILHWKLRRQYFRQIKLREQNTDITVKAITQSAFAIRNADKNIETEQRLKTLIKLCGVQIPVASAILTLCFPEQYSVIDFRGWRQVFGEVKKYSNYSTKEYIKYLSIIKQVAIKFSLTTQEVDMAIWQNDIEVNSRKF